ncbi:MAG: hypothetical protein IJI47_00290 [Eubacterium sp.]|nr:hypothetical protein [Eubacterium sp.]
MKRAVIIFALIFLLTALIPLAAFFKDRKQTETDEMVTLFSSYESAACQEFV